MKNKYLEESLNSFDHTLYEYKELKHNVINDFMFIKTIIDENEQSLLDEKLKKYSKNYNTMIDIDLIPKGFQGLAYIKTLLAKQKNVQLVIKIQEFEECENLEHKLYIDLCEILAISLDNAIEAASDSKDKSVFVSGKIASDGITVEIFNSFNNSIDLNKLGDRGYTTKEGGSGIGLNYISELNNKITVKKEIIDNLFKTIISIDNIK